MFSSEVLKIFLIISCQSFVTTVIAGPKYNPTKGEVWPKPQNQIRRLKYYVLENMYAFNVTKPYYNCAIVDEAVKRLLYGTLKNKFRFINKAQTIKSIKESETFFAGYLTRLTEFRIKLIRKCEILPHLEMDESYELDVGDSISLYSASVWGILRGLQTFSQLLYFSEDFTEIRINATTIQDYPAYTHRGLLIDTGRHYLPTKVISRLIDSMEMNKLNVLHWHIVDDQSFPYQSEIFPELSKKGAFHSSMVYTKEDIQGLVEQARLAGIRVIPEFDIPGHVQSWGKSYPNILTKCYKNKIKESLGPLNPVKKATYKFLDLLYKEVGKLFPDEFIHIGGDEVDVHCWKSNPRIKEYKWKGLLQSTLSEVSPKVFLKINSLKERMKSLHSYFINKVISLLPPQVQPILWQDVYDMGSKLPRNTIIQVWRYGWTKEMNKLLVDNYRVLFSSMWYLDMVNQKWETYYESDPRSIVYMSQLTRNYIYFDLQSLNGIIGGEACMWGEMVDETNIFTKVWPNTAAVAERLWSGLSYHVNTTSIVTNEVRRRLEEHSCRMRQADIPVAPAFGPSFCLQEPL